MIRCTTCGAPLAHDQRYCVYCGERRGALPEYVSHLIAGILERGHAQDLAGVAGPAGAAGAAAAGAAAIGAAAASETAGGAGGAAAEDGAGRPAWTGGWLPSPRLAAVAVMGMLAFGAEIGSLVAASGVVTAASTPLIVLQQHGSPPPTAVASAPANTGSSGSFNGGGGSSGGGSSGGGSTQPAAAPASTTTTSTNTTVPSTGTVPSTSTNPYGLPDIKHVFVIMLGNVGYSQTFGSRDTYLARTLPRQGKLMQFYYGVAGGELANQIAVVSGQGPTVQTEADCSEFANVTPGTKSRFSQVLGQGCVYPAATKTLAGQLTAHHLTWKAYVQGIADGPAGQTKACRHPGLGKTDSDQAARSGDPYVTWRNPFVYFHSVIGSSTCAQDDVDLSKLATDLKSSSATPNLSYIVPDPCDDGSAQPCTPGAHAGTAAADAFLRKVLPEIEASAAYKAGGVIAITSDQAPQTGPQADSSACCSTPTYPNLPKPGSTTTPTTPTTPTAGTPTTPAAGTPTTPTTPAAGTPTTPPTGTPTTPTTSTATTPTSAASTPTTPTAPATTTTPTTPTTPATTPTTGTTTPTTPTTPTTTAPTSTSPDLGLGQTTPTGGGGQVGLLLISPWVKPNSMDTIDYFNHYSLLASLEDIFNLGHLGYAAQIGVAAFDSGTFDGTGPSTGSTGSSGSTGSTG